MKQIVAIVLASILLGAMVATPSDASIRAMPEFEQADAVFVGTVIDSEKVLGPFTDPPRGQKKKTPDMDLFYTTLKVDRIYKGEALRAEEIVYETYPKHEVKNIGFDPAFENGKQYLLFGRKSGNHQVYITSRLSKAEKTELYRKGEKWSYYRIIKYQRLQ